MEELLDIHELAAKLKVPVSWLYNRTRKNGPGIIPHYRLGKYIRFKESEVLAFLRKSEFREQR